MDVDLAAIICPENIRTTEIRRARLGDRLLQYPRTVGKLTANIDIRLLHVVRPARDHDPLDHLVRILMDDIAILERPWLRRVRIDDEINRFAALAIDESPFHSTRESRTAATADARFLHLVDD